MPLTSLVHSDWLDTLEAHALTAPPGAFAELGVYRGGSAERLYRVAMRRRVTLYLFDTFGPGIPEASAGDSHAVGDFSVTDDDVRALREAMPEAVFVAGQFPASVFWACITLPKMALVHVDCDQYETTLAACRIFGDRMAPQGVMVFDDYGLLDNATKAVDLYVAERKMGLLGGSHNQKRFLRF